jgi:tetratricopeptide (TPR) repeat protein
MLLGLLNTLIYGAGILTLVYVIIAGTSYLRFQKIKTIRVSHGTGDDTDDSAQDTADLYCQRALFFHERECFAAAIGDYSKALELNREHPIAAPNRERAFARQQPRGDQPEKLKETVPDKEVAVSLGEPDDSDRFAAQEIIADLPKDHLKLGILQVRKGRPKEALTEFSLAIEQDDSSSAAFMNRGITHARMNNNEMALDDLNKAIELDSKVAAAFLNRGIVYLKIHDYDKATNDFDTAIELNPKYAVAYKKRGEANIRKNLFDDAITDFCEAIRSSPNYADAYISRGKAYAQRGMHAQAKSDFIAAKQFKPDIAQVYYQRGKSQLKANEILQALDYFKIACDLGDQNACSEYRKAKAKITG